MVNKKEDISRMDEHPNSKYLRVAKEKIRKGVDKFPNQFDLLTVISDVYRTSGNHLKSLRCAEVLIANYPYNWVGYGFAAKDLVALDEFEEAQKQIQIGLQKIPYQFDLLFIATDVYRATGDIQKSMDYAELLIIHHPEKWVGYKYLIHEAIISQQLDKARCIAEKAISKTKEDKRFFAILSDIAFALGDEEMYDKYERLVVKDSSNNIYERLNITPKSIKSQLLVEYAVANDERADRRITKPDLYIVAGFSGAGKTTFLHSSFFSIEKVFGTEDAFLKMLPVEISKFLALRRELWDNRDQSMLFSDAFTDIEFLYEQNILPRQTLLHLNITHLLLKGHPKLFGLNPLKPDDLESPKNLNDYLKRFFATRFFNKFQSISIATIDIDYDTNAERYSSRTGNKFQFSSNMKNGYKRIMEAWHDQVSHLPTIADNIIKERDGLYLIQKK